MAKALNLITLLLECRGFSLSLPGRKWRALIYYTQISNLLAALSCLLLLVLGPERKFVVLMRYSAVCMLVMTALVTVGILVPMGADPQRMLWSGNGLYHHVLCPLLATLSYLFAEFHAPPGAALFPVLLTLVYGVVMTGLNASGRVDGPYPFFRVRSQTPKATVLWILALMALISGICAAVWALAGQGGNNGRI